MTTHTLNSDVIAIGAAGAPAFTNAWTNWGGGNQVAGFWKDPAGHVHVRGLITGGAAGTVAFTLPVGFRPALQEVFIGSQNGTAVTSIFVNNAGQVTIINSGVAVYISLARIFFLAEG